jgi:hypothetical protein
MHLSNAGARHGVKHLISVLHPLLRRDFPPISYEIAGGVTACEVHKSDFDPRSSCAIWACNIFGADQSGTRDAPVCLIHAVPIIFASIVSSTGRCST